MLHDRMTGTTRVMATAGSRLAEIDYVRGSHDAVVYTELARAANEQVPGGLAVPWKDYLIDLRSGRRLVIISSANADAREAILPFPAIEWPWVVDSIPSARGGLRVLAYNLRTHKSHVVFSPKSGIGSLSLASGMIAYWGLTEGTVHGYDAYLISVTGNENPRALTRSGAVADVVAANGGISWHEPNSGDPTSLWWSSLDSLRPVQFADGGSNAFPGQGFVVWLTEAPGGDLVVGPPKKNAATVVLAEGCLEGSCLDTGARWWVSGEEVTWAVQEAGQTSIVVARVHVQT